jgi:spermidine synthase
MTSRDENAIEAERAKCQFDLTEEIYPGVKTQIQLKSILHSAVSNYQSIQVVETYYGMTLLIDGKTQSSKFDEFVYHESLVHPSLLQSALLSNDEGPTTVFIGGGGELATAREVLRHKSVKRVVMVDLDGDVIEVCKKYLPEWGGEKVATDPRLELIVGDAYAYLMNTEETFDVIIMDISDPIEAGPGKTNRFSNIGTQVVGHRCSHRGHSMQESCYIPKSFTSAP